MSIHKPQHVDISTASIVRFFAVILGLLLLWQIKDILALLFVVLIVVAALSPAVDWLTQRSVPRALSVTLLYIVLFILFGFFISLLLPPLVEQIHALAVAFPTIVQQLTPLYELVIESNTQQLLQSLSSQLSNFTQGVFAATAQLFGGVAAFLTVIVISFYMLIDAKQAKDTLVTILPAAKVNASIKMLEKAMDKLGSWFRGQVLISIIIGVLTFVGLLILRVPFALTLAVTTGVLSIIPILGAIIAGIVTVIVAYAAGSWTLALGALIFYTVVQQIESNFLVPKIMQSAVGLSPVVVIVALAVGAKLAGVTGAVIAVPLTAVLAVLVQQWPRSRKS